ncbi:MAG: hypothetical protein ACRC9Q_00700 [Bacteroidales bacterium]
MKLMRIFIPSLFAMIPFVSWAQYIPEDDLYYTKKDENAIVKAQKERNKKDNSRNQNATSQAFMDVDEYNRRTPVGAVITSDQDTLLLEEGKKYVFKDADEGYLNGFNGSVSDFENAERIRRFHNPKFTIHISDPMYNEIFMLSNSDWNVYVDDFYATITPTWTNPYHWNYAWSPAFYSGWSWRLDPWGWGYPNWGWGMASSWWGPSWGCYPGWHGGGWYPGWNGGGWYPGHNHHVGSYYSAYEYSGGRRPAGNVSGGRTNGTYTSNGRSNRYTGGSTSSGRTSGNYSVGTSSGKNNSNISTSGGRSTRYQSNSTEGRVYRPSREVRSSSESNSNTTGTTYDRTTRSSRSSSESYSSPSRSSFERSSSSGSSRSGSYGGGSYGGGRSSGGRR